MIVRGLVFITGLSVALCACQPQAPHATQKAALAPAASSNWRYFSKTDEMRETTRYNAAVESDNFVTKDGTDTSKVTLALQYDGAAPPFIVLIINRAGAFECDLKHDTVNVKFDNGKITDFPCESPSEGAASVVISNIDEEHELVMKYTHSKDPGTTFVDQLKTAKRLIIEAPVSGAGDQEFIFNVQGFDEAKLHGKAP